MNQRTRKKLAKRFKVTKHQRQQLRSYGIAVILVLIGILAGLALADRLLNQPSNSRIWAADASVQIPDDLYTFLQELPACEHPVTSQPGVRLWSVMQVEQSKFARLAYGCSTVLEQYQMAVRTNSNWQLLPTDEYFADSEATALPSCKAVNDYAIPATIEPFCVNNKGKAVSNDR